MKGQISALNLQLPTEAMSQTGRFIPSDSNYTGHSWVISGMTERVGAVKLQFNKGSMKNVQEFDFVLTKSLVPKDATGKRGTVN